MINVPILGNKAVSAIVPHKGRMSLLENILSIDLQQRSLVAEALVTGTSPLYDVQHEREPGFITFEYIAQAISAFSFLRDDDEHAMPQIGYILKVDHFVIKEPFLHKGDLVTVTVTENCNVDENLSSFYGTVTHKDAMIATGHLLVYKTKAGKRG